jgi:CBS domain-containing protein
MKTLNQAVPNVQMVLGTSTAKDLMTPNPMSIREGATVSEAAAFLACKCISAAPVIDEAGRPVGVVSSTDILIHFGQGSVHRCLSPAYLELPKGSAFSKVGFRVEATCHCSVRDVMTPGIFCVRPGTPAGKLIEKMMAQKVRRLFVVDGDDVLIGVVSAFDVVGKLRQSCLHDG